MADTPSPPPLSPSGPPGPSVGLALPDVGEFWPLFIIALGVWILLGAIRRGER